MASSNAIKRQRKRRRVDTDGDPEFQVAPMVDVLLVLLLFFMAITSTEVLQKHQNIQLADANHAKPNDSPDQSKAKHEITVNVEWNEGSSSAQFDLDPISSPTAQGIQGELARRHAADAQSYVVIRADKDVQYSNVSDLMAVCGDAGIGTVSFAVLKPAQAAPAATK